LKRLAAFALLVAFLGPGTTHAARPRKKPRATRSAPARPAEPPNAEIQGAANLRAFFDRLSELPVPPVGPGAAGADVVRVLHFGDSHVAADYWSGELRRLLQERFGDAGPGVVLPGRPWRYFRHALAKSPPGTGWETLGLSHEPGDGFYGLAGVAMVPREGEGVAAVEGAFRDFAVEVGSFSPGGCLAVWVDGNAYFAGTLDQPEAVDPDSEECSVTEQDAPERSGFVVSRIRPRELLPEGPHRLEVRAGCGGAPRLLSVDLRSGGSGISWDTLGINGAELFRLDGWDPELRGSLLAAADPALVVVSYGTNDMGRGDLGYGWYKAAALQILGDLKRDAPDASILVTGPIDRGARKRKVRSILASNEPTVVRALRDAAHETGAAFWDARAAMGGAGSIVRWASAGLAQRDLVHLTGRGYAKLAQLLHERLMYSWGRYRESAASHATASRRSPTTE